MANQFGTIKESVESLRALTADAKWLIVGNVTGVVRVGGALISTCSNVTITNSSFENNSADIGGDIYAESSKLSIFNSNFKENGPEPVVEASAFGGAIFSHQSTIFVMECQFHNKHATAGASLVTSLSNVTLDRSTFDSNSATDHAGGLFAYRGTVFIVESTFHNNTALGGGGVTIHRGEINVSMSNFTFNRVDQHGGALDIILSSVTISACHFEGNIAGSFAGAVLLYQSTSKIIGGKAEQDCDVYSNDSYQGTVSTNCPLESSLGFETRFISNSAPTGAALYVIKCIIQSCGSIFITRNFATLRSSVYLLNSDWHFSGSIELTQNLGSFFAHQSNITFSGCASFTNCSPPENTTANFREGGGLTLHQTALTFHGRVKFLYNHAETGGAIAAMESDIYLNDEVYVFNNSASVSGGGLYLSQSKLISLLESNVNISSNYATENGGGVHAISSLINCIVSGSQYTALNGKLTEKYSGTILYITENSAQKGGAIYLEANSKVSVLKDYIFATIKHSAVNFIGNSAWYGGAIYVDDTTNSSTCSSNPFDVMSPKSECFISVVSIHAYATTNINFRLTNILFNSNTATLSGPTLFGGLLDRCIVNPFNEIDQTVDRNTNQLLTYEGDALQYFMDISSEKKTQSISSYPVQVCPCIDNQQQCGYKINRYAEVKKGYLFSISLIAVDQVDRPVNATIEGRLYSARSILLYGQVTNVPDRCTNVSFRIISAHASEELTLFASDGPCKDAGLSPLKVSVTFLPCACPIGFRLSDELNGDSCLCVCDSQIRPYVIECNSTTQSFRRAENVWISYFSSNNSSGYLVYKYCPFDYCTPPNTSEPIDLNKHEGSDAQCALNRTGLLCGACKPGLSLSLGSSRCLKCPKYWPVLFVFITVISILGGFGLVILLLWLNITVAAGTLNGLLFYANIVAANRVVLLPYPEPNLITIFISWLNLELGIDFCYIKGMDIYTRTWLQLAFPTYIIFLVVLLIIISRYSSRFSNLIAKRNPVATLATLILISYGKLFHVVLLAQPFSYAVLTYPENTMKVLWLPDGTLQYLKGKHIILFCVALIILAFCITYSFLLLCWQCLHQIPNWKIVKCINSPTLNIFMEAYHVPYTAKHRYWTGLLLFARAIIYIIATVNVSGDPQIQLVSIIVVLSCVILLKMFIATKIFKNWLIDSLESFFYFNIIILASFTAYNLSTGNNQDGVAYTSVILSMVVTLFILLYHVYMYTPLFRRLSNSKFVMNIENRLTVKSEPQSSENRRPSIMNSIRRYDDTIDILMSDADRYNSNSSGSTANDSEQQQQTTESVVEID